MQISKHTVHSTDYIFQRLCEEKFGVNRGVYNTIDCWFYEKGMGDILKRRKEILNFLQFLTCKLDGNHPIKVKFGKGGLVKNLDEFWRKETLYHTH
jgi:riboflavin kinase